MGKDKDDPIARIMAYFAMLRSDRPRVEQEHPGAVLLAEGYVPLLPDQFAYVVDYRANRVVAARGFQHVLGYPDEDITLDFIFRYIHPDDLSAVTRIVERAVRLMIATRPLVPPYGSVMSIDYRVLKANGEYIKILRQVTVHEVDHATGSVISTLSVCKDISNIKPSNQVGWQALGPGTEDMDMSDILQVVGNLVYRPTSREMDIIRKLAEGKNSKTIGLELHISEHTVNNHRRNLLQRTGLKNTAELVRRMTEGGLL